MHIFEFCKQSVESTQSAIIEHFKIFNDDEDALIVMRAKEQTKGRGRNDREWISKGDCIAISFAFVFRGERQAAPLLGQFLSIIATESLNEKTNANFGIKWPNDIILDTFKVGGVIAELIVYQGSQVAVLGLGLNIDVPQDMLPQRPLYPASSINHLLPNISLKSESFLKETLIPSFSRALPQLLAGGLKTIPEKLNKVLKGIGKPVRVIESNEITFCGTNCGVSDKGGLLVLNEGKMREVFVGDILHLL